MILRRPLNCNIIEAAFIVSTLSIISIIIIIIVVIMRIVASTSYGIKLYSNEFGFLHAVLHMNVIKLARNLGPIYINHHLFRTLGTCHVQT